MFSIVQAGSSLQVVETDGSLTTLTLPSGVTIDATIQGVFAVLNQQIVFVGAPSVSLWIDVSTTPFTVNPLSLRGPLGAPNISGTGSGVLTGDFRVKYSFIVKNAAGQVIVESPLSPQSLEATLASDQLLIENLELPGDSWATGRRIYRTLADGSLFFKLLDIDDVASTAVISNLPDETLERLPELGNLGNPPGAVVGTSFVNIVSWKSRLWAVTGDPATSDELNYSELNQFYAWPGNIFKADPKGEDQFGITGLMPRRDTLGFAKRSRLYKVTGNSTSDFAVRIVGEGLGCLAPKSVVIIRDKAYYLGLDGVYRWDDAGAICISRATVDGWFTSDTYFNRALFPLAFANFNPFTNMYELCLAPAGASTFTQWVKFSLDKEQWIGPDSTAAFTPVSRILAFDEESQAVPLIGGSDGFLYQQNQATPSDVSGALVASAISSRLDTKWHSGKAPDIDHFWGQLSVLSRIESGGTLTVTATVGRLNSSATSALTHDLTLGRERMARLCEQSTPGALMKLSFTQATAGRRWLLFGIEVDPVFEVGRR